MKRRLTIRVLALVSAITCALCGLPRIAAVEAAAEVVTGGCIEGTVYTVDAGGSLSAVPSAVVRLIGPSFSQQTVTNDQGRYRFSTVGADAYRIDAMAPGLSGSNTVTFVSG